ncbi:uncharacterized protein LOC143356297 [Halictus rubicundus]|uniref:uncharacterized protein LOC143356297 n=1 Tax=Halictus rubicundus TaxID=77578 RepID=UPI0040361E2A
MIVNATDAVCNRTVEAQSRRVACTSPFNLQRSTQSGQIGNAIPNNKSGQKMTPLPRWVLLASLLAGVGAHPIEHACVRLCVAQKMITGAARGCHDYRRFVLQSSGGRLPSQQQLFSLCLIPCGEPGSPNSPQYDSSVTCRVFRRSLIRDHGCHCDWKTGRVLEDDRIIDAILLQDVDHHSLRRSFSPNVLEKGGQVPVDPLNDWKSTPLEDKMKLADDYEEDRLGIRERLDPKGTFNLSPESPDASESVDSPVDWDLWCMAQCDNGHGGSACNCDLIP